MGAVFNDVPDTFLRGFSAQIRIAPLGYDHIDVVLAAVHMEKMMNVPTFSFDTPFRRDERGAEYLADQIEDFIAFMEENTGHKLDWDKLKYYMTVPKREMRDIAKNTAKKGG